MRILDKKTVWLILFFCLPLLFLPKINLIKLSEKETAGFRLDDIFLLSASFVLFWARFSLKSHLSQFEKRLFILVGFSLFSFLCNRLLVDFGILHVNAKIFYCFRILEYSTFFYIGALAFPYMNDRKILYTFLIWNMCLMAAQKAGLIGGFNSYGYDAQNTYRATGIASFPSEMGALLNLLFCYIIFDQIPMKGPAFYFPHWLEKLYFKIKIYFQFILFAIFTIFSGSRVAVVGLIVPFLTKIKAQVSAKTILIILIFMTAIGASVAYLVINTEGLRSASLLSFKNVELVKEAWDEIDINIEPNASTLFTEEKFDQSWWMRLNKWAYALKIYLMHPECYLQGIGPGFAFAALDGGLLRILTENGIIGAYLYWIFFASIFNQSRQLAWMVVVFMMNMIFFDVYLAYKPMILLFFVSGYTYARQNNENQALSCASPPPLQV